MISLSEVERQLKKVGCHFRFWGRPEIRELCHILIPGEQIAQAVNGQYEGGFAMLVLTDQRMLLVDKKPMFLTLEDIRFDMVSEIDYTYQLLGCSITVQTPNKKLGFSSWNQQRLRTLVTLLQQKISELRSPIIQKHLQIVQAAHNDWTAPVVGSIMLQSAAPHMLPINPYTRIPLSMRRRRVPKFY